MNRIHAVASLAAVFLSLTCPLSMAQAPSSEPGMRNVILIIGDGMDEQQITIARNYLHGANGKLELDQPSACAISCVATATCSFRCSASVEMRSGPKLAWPAIGRPYWSLRHVVAHAIVAPCVGRAVTKRTKSAEA